jgi:D-ornithine 4,5-aminomutase subunit alpha
MRREDDFAERRKHIADLTDDELYARFWDHNTGCHTAL